MPGTTTVRISERSHRVLRAISEKTGKSIGDVLDEIVSNWEDRQFFKQLNESYEALRANPIALEEELEERRLWDQTLNDNLEE